MRIRDDKTIKEVSEYWSDRGFRPVVSSSIFTVLRLLFMKRDRAIVVTSKRFEVRAAKMLGMQTTGARASIAAARRHLAFKDALVFLAKKKVPVYFFNRVGMLKTGFRYSDSALRRMREGASFTKMLEQPSHFEADLGELFGEKYSPEYLRDMGDIPQVVRKGVNYCHEDHASRFVNVIGGFRVTVGQPKRFSRSIHVYGRCGVFGYAVEDADTLPSRMQSDLLSRGYGDIRVVNHGLWGGSDDMLDDNFIHDAMSIKPGDVVVFYRKHFEPALTNTFQRCGLRYFDITAEWHRASEAKWCFYDRPGHMNNIGYRLAAGLIVSALLGTGLACAEVAKSVLQDFRAAHMLEYLKSFGDKNFDDGIKAFLSAVRAVAPDNGSSNNGAVVMNCNPFTNGHLRLVESASRLVDRLYVFVVEEDKSFFTFNDRIEMVRRGVEHLENVVVAPSGRFIISSFTFPEYFLKDYVREKAFDVSSDVRTFCELIAPPLGIRVRFAGEEPFDPVTGNYNRAMQKILPEYGMEFHVVPRFTSDDGEAINATEVRRKLSRGDFEGLKFFVPPTTLAILRQRYAKKEE